MLVHAHLTFNGNCRQAMTFYQECFGGKLVLQTVGESPLSGPMSPRMKDCILQATLTRDSMVLMGSDMVSDSGLIKGNAVTLVLRCRSARELKTLYEKLSAGGSGIHPPEVNFSGVWLGQLTDRYGNPWLLTYDQKGIDPPILQ